MMFIDMTKDLMPVLFGLDAALMVSAAALVGQSVLNLWSHPAGRIERPRLQWQLPVLAR